MQSAVENENGGTTEGQDASSPTGADDAKVEVFLAPLNSTDMGRCQYWRNLWDINRWCRQSDFINDREQALWWQYISTAHDVKMYKIMTRMEGKDPVWVGVCGLTTIRMHHGTAEFSLYVDPSMQGGKLGQQALKLLIDRGFAELRLNQIYGEVFEGNPALKMFQEIGFKREGEHPDRYYKDGKFIKSISIGLGVNEWRLIKQSRL